MLDTFLRKILDFLYFRRPRKQRKVLAGAMVALGTIVVSGGIFYATTLRAPSLFPRGGVMAIAGGQSLSTIAKTLEQENLIRSPFWFVNAVLILGKEHEVVAGDYYFPQAENVFTLAWRLTRGNYQTEQAKTIITDDMSVSQIAVILKKIYPTFDTVHFITIATPKEGYLYPDTYYFGVVPSPEDVVTTMSANFERKISNATTAAAITAFDKPFSDVLNMASIVEREALTPTDRQIVAGILWKRLAMGMPLQVDATLYYITGRGSAELTTGDLANKSPYNTYTHKGLPPTPIGNPGLDAIMATLTPIKTDYLYFLSDTDGTMHYAATLNKQHANQALYLN